MYWPETGMPLRAKLLTNLRYFRAIEAFRAVKNDKMCVGTVKISHTLASRKRIVHKYSSLDETLCLYTCVNVCVSSKDRYIDVR